jgi:hypothetical protein
MVNKVNIELTIEQAAALGYILDETSVEHDLAKEIRREHAMAVMLYYSRKRKDITV